MSLAQRTLALAEGRQIEELAEMLQREGATVIRCPMVSILDPADEGPLRAWLDELGADRFHLVIFLTGEGVRRLLACAERHALKDRVIAALQRTRLVTRGPKPVRALKDVGLAPAIVARVPTTDGVIAALHAEPLQGKVVGVQLYNEANVPLATFLENGGAVVRTVQPYVYAPAADGDRVVDLIGKLEQGNVDALVFTSSPQIDRLFEVAHERSLDAQLARGLSATRVAAVGPIVAENLQRRGVRVDICPEQGFVMKNLVQWIKRSL